MDEKASEMQPVETVDSLPQLIQSIDQQGYSLWSQPLDPEEVKRLCEAFENQPQAKAGIRRANQLYARRNLLEEVPEVLALARSEAVQSLVRAVLGNDTSMLRALLFDKIPAANWHVGWHQDLMVPLAARHEVPGFSAWSVKEGVTHAKPPAEILQQILILRVHLDDCQQENGPLRVLPGSHLQGELSADAVKQWITTKEAQVCLASQGSILAMRPLVLHSSSPAANPSHRRVVHLEFAKNCLPAPLHWPNVN